MRVNLWAVIVSAIVHFALGALWFGLIFGPAWTAGSHMSQAEIAAAQKDVAGPFAVAFLGSVVIAFVVAKVIVAAGQTTAIGGIRVGLVLGLGIAFAAMVIEMVFERREFGFMLISAAYPVVGMAIMGAILGAWQCKPKAAAA